jgi:hypothetical protein
VLRGGLDSSHSSGLDAVSTLTGGVGLRLGKVQLSYAWVPYGDLGNANYLTLDLRFGGPKEERSEGLIKFEKDKDEETSAPRREGSDEYQELQDILSPNERKALPSYSKPSGEERK